MPIPLLVLFQFQYLELNRKMIQNFVSYVRKIYSLYSITNTINVYEGGVDEVAIIEYILRRKLKDFFYQDSA